MSFHSYSCLIDLSIVDRHCRFLLSVDSVDSFRIENPVTMYLHRDEKNCLI